MEIIIAIVAVVFVVSLYDFFAARRWQQISSSERNDMVFEHRNREYGAYVIRKNYDVRMLIILGSVIFGIGTVYGIYRIVQNIEVAPPPPPPIDDATFAVAAPPEEETPPPPPEPEVPQLQKTVAFVPPVVTNDEQAPPPKDQSELENETVSNIDQEGQEDVFNTPVQTAVVQKVEVKNDEPLLTAEEPAEFPGGMAALKRFLGENLVYPQTAVEDQIEGKAFLKFVVDEQGDISRVSVSRGVAGCPECDKEAIRVVKKMPRWKPGRNGGKAVKMYYNLPITFKLQ